MKILLFGGFLGSGKTTIIRAFIDAVLAGEMGTVAIIENEIGEVGVDDVLLREGSVKITPLFGGCVCCEITGNLIVAVDEIYKQVDPGWLIIELTGVAELLNVKELLEKYSRIGLEIATIAVVDGSRWARLQIIGDFIRNQVMGCDLIILNKADLCTDTEPVVDSLIEVTGVSDVMLMGANHDRIAESDQILRKLFHLQCDCHDHDEHEHGHDGDGHDHEDHEHDDHDHDDHDGHDHDHDHDHEDRVVGAYSVTCTVHPEAARDRAALVERLATFFADAGELLSRDDIIYGHVKGILQESEDSFVRFSLTRRGEPDILLSGAWTAAADSLPGPLSLTMNNNSMIHTESEIADLLAPCVKRHAALFADIQ